MVTRMLRVCDTFEGNVLATYIDGFGICLIFYNLDDRNNQFTFSFDGEKDVTEFINELQKLKKELYGK